ncbi:galactose-binding domain-like protein [Thelephora terrestris]|uniref:Galactose-binding domain-like protein n=1 Tax=Thelephora terrestris TaxID=56493 RepID=A0A9P6L8F8_9AGAM|nr:galactose-binding domain-like protein [Thelephora terrestris]
MQNLITTGTQIKVSSTLNKSVGKTYLTDGNPETCWTSQQGLPQTIQLMFPSPVIPRQVSITFQGGFVGTCCSIHVASPTSNEWEIAAKIFPEDNNRPQSFTLTPDSSNLLDAGVGKLKLIFEESSDFFGRITIYDLRLEGDVVQ